VDVLSNDIKNIGDLLGSLKNVGTNWAASHLANQTSNWANNALTASFGDEGASRIKSALATIMAVADLAGSIFGPRPSDRMEGVTRHFNPDGTVTRTEQDLGPNKDSPENRAAVNALDTAVMSFIDSLKGYGLQTSGLWAYAVEAGSGNSLQPFQAHVNNSGTQGFATAEDAFKWVADQLVDTLGTVPARLQSIVDNFDGTNVEEFFNNLERVQNFETSLANVSSDLLKLTNPEAWETKQVTDWFNAMRAEAIDLGYDVTGAIFKPVIDLRDAQLADIAARYHPVTPAAPAAPTPPLEATANWLTIIGGLYDDRIAQLQDEAAALRDSAQAWDRVNQALKQTRSSLLIDPTLSPLSLEARRTEAFSQLQSTFDKAKAGDADAAAQLPELARAALTASREFYRSSEDYFTDFNKVQNMLGAAQSYAQQQVDVAKQSLATQLAILETLQSQRAGLGTPGGAPKYNTADVAKITTEFQAAWQRSGLSRSDFLASDEGQNIWLPIRQQWIAGISDQAQLTASLQAARSQKSEGGYAASDAVLFEQQVTNRMRELGFDVPSMAVGGMVRRTGLVYAHQGEHITPAGGMSGIEKTVAGLKAEIASLTSLLAATGSRQIEHLAEIAGNTGTMQRADVMAAVNARFAGRSKGPR
ncbi:MAG: hypothetical protein IT566_16650, partial [Rhodospirillaceae bacterium]|nr:hypothetical protein [Rhodospirillaceae bacterium]